MISPPPDLVEIAETLEIMSKPHLGSGWKALAKIIEPGLPVTTERQERIWKEHQ